MSATNSFTETHGASTTAEAVDTDAVGDVQIEVPELRTIENAAEVSASSPDGYVVNVQSVSGNKVTVRVYEEAGAAGTLTPVSGTADVTDVHVHAQGY